MQLTVLPGLDHYFNPVSSEPISDRVSLEGLRRPMAREALETISGWALRVLG